ncbi:hypothetical protein EJB05_13613 [Eragrostis curvula]|uniref:Uncharacterized protein n=1 Tax=Eragrostis curvula TaxID=38414 RepID=A0A5J9VWR6_9POAL|nr:hypothetical protein EJB05_13613 [Eragrostis curvula]
MDLSTPSAPLQQSAMPVRLPPAFNPEMKLPHHPRHERCCFITSSSKRAKSLLVITRFFIFSRVFLFSRSRFGNQLQGYHKSISCSMGLVHQNIALIFITLEANTQKTKIQVWKMMLKQSDGVGAAGDTSGITLFNSLFLVCLQLDVVSFKGRHLLLKELHILVLELQLLFQSLGFIL